MKKNYLSVLFSLILFTASAQLSPHSLRCLTLGTPDGSQTQYNEIGYYIENSPVEYNGCQTTPAIMIAVMDNFCQPWSTCDHNFGQSNQFVLNSGTCSSNPVGYIPGCSRQRAEKYFMFHYSNAVEMQNMKSMFDSVPIGNYILAYTWYTYPYSTASVSFQTAFQNLGSIAISTLPDNFPYIFFIQKGDPSTLVELVGNSGGDTLILNSTISCLTSLVSEIEDVKMELYPDSVADFLHFKGKGGKFDWNVYDVTGKLVLKGENTGNYGTIDLSGLTGGVYIFRLKEGREFNRLIIKE